MRLQQWARRLPAGEYRGAAVLLLDALAAVAALSGATWLRFEGRIPDLYGAALWLALPLLVSVRLGLGVAARLQQWSFRMAGLTDAVRIVIATAAGTAAFVALFAAISPTPLPRTVYALEFFLTTAMLGSVRFAPRVAVRWWGDRRLLAAGAARTLIVGVDRAGELLARDITQTPDSPYAVVGFVGDDPTLVGSRIDGRPVLGGVGDLPRLVREHAIAMVLLAMPDQPAARIREILDLCSTSRARFKIMPASYVHVDRRLSSAMLNDVSPEDLLPRDTVRFDETELRSLVVGRRALVTGAGGSIGGEICRQLVRYGVKQLVMVDMNENELYLLARQLMSDHPDAEIRAEVADVREPSRLLRLGAGFRPQYVFHAAAHKHVPLMEDAPEEAVKNNVFGTRNVALMADACGAERFVLISTDKAVNPTSVMGATKRVAELVVRDLARRSQTRMTAVRFGNVLGSAGSVVPIFKRQIERGGPVTVTHEDCTRYFMTIPEAVGLVLVAGLLDYGELCVLDMGEPIRIADLARNMITLAGRVPGEEIPVVFTGLRPGEKLYEELLTEEEEQTHAVRHRINTATSPAPPPDLQDRLADLLTIAQAGDRDAVLRAIKGLVPTYRVTPGAPRARPTAVAPVLAQPGPLPAWAIPTGATGGLDGAAVAAAMRSAP